MGEVSESSDEGAGVEPIDVVALLEGLPTELRQVRQARGISLRQAAQEMDYPYADLCRFERRKQGKQGMTLKSTLKVLRWINDQREAMRNVDD